MKDEFSGEELVQESPKFFGMDYFRVIYVGLTFLIILMSVVYFSIDDEKM